jgi:hypothetical protein
LDIKIPLGNQSLRSPNTEKETAQELDIISAGEPRPASLPCDPAASSDRAQGKSKTRDMRKLDKMTATRTNRWTPLEDDDFRRMAEANICPELIAKELNRSVHAVKARAYAIGLPLKWFKMKAKRK